ncbi:MAG: hypothetical protein C0402_04780 [Thermodesulfovibrio sp.]|nr:hypothetical protein [Thermodesulfovibrio sp.]
MNGRKNILVIDPDKLVCKIIKVFLENTGKYRVTYSTDVAKGLMSALSRRVKLILFDEHIQAAEGLNLSDLVLSNRKKLIPLLPTGIVIDKAKLRMQHVELNTVFNRTMLNRIEELMGHTQ